MPLIVWALIAAASLGLAAIAAWTIRGWLGSRTRVADIGRPATGKSTMLRLLKTGKVPAKGLAPTTEPEEAEISIPGGITITVTDSGGDRLHQQNQAVSKATGVVYFFDAHRVEIGDPDTLSALEADADHIDVMFQTQDHSRRFTLVGTHSDLLVGSDAVSTVRRHPVVQRLRQAAGAGGDDIVLGSLASNKAALKLAAEVAKRQGHRA